MLILAVVPVLAALATLAWVRRRSDGEATSKHLRAVAWVAAGVVSAGLAFVLIEGALPHLFGALPLTHPTGWGALARFFAMLGATMYVLMRVVVFNITSALQRWSCRLSPEHEVTLGCWLLVEASLLACFVGAFTLAGTLGFLATLADLPPWPFAVTVAAIIPLCQTVAVPWIAYARAPSLTSRNLTDVEQWLAQVRTTRALPHFAVRVQEGRVANAFATAGLGAHLVVIGGRLLDRMTQSELRGVLAHEIAHVEMRHVPKRVLPLVLISSMLYVACVFSMANPLLDTEELPSVLAGLALIMVFAATFYAILPSFFLRRMEFQADRLAVEILGGPRPLADALRKLAELDGQSLDKQSWSHPSMRARLAALDALEQ